MRYTVKHLRWWHVWDNAAKTVVSSQATQEAAELVAYELNKGEIAMPTNQPVNLYFPNAWIEEASREIEYRMYTGEHKPGFHDYLKGLRQVTEDGWGWAAMVAGINLGRVYVTVPAWVYTHQRDPNKHDYRVFDGTEGE